MTITNNVTIMFIKYSGKQNKKNGKSKMEVHFWEVKNKITVSNHTTWTEA